MPKRRDRKRKPEPPTEAEQAAQSAEFQRQIRLWLETDDGPEPEFYRRGLG